MFDKAISKGVNLQTETQVQSILEVDGSEGFWIVRTDRGDVRTKKVILTTNAYTSALLPEYKDKIIPYRALCCKIECPKTAPLLTNSYSLRFNDWDFDYLIPRPDGSIIVGGGRAAYLPYLDDWYGNVDDSTLIDRAKGYFDGYMQRHFRGWEHSGAQVSHIWSGSEYSFHPLHLTE
jgi:glycine/D-amino acid oxidase-like deaminating enzyme